MQKFNETRLGELNRARAKTLINHCSSYIVQTNTLSQAKQEKESKGAGSQSAKQRAENGRLRTIFSENITSHKGITVRGESLLFRSNHRHLGSAWALGLGKDGEGGSTWELALLSRLCLGHKTTIRVSPKKLLSTLFRDCCSDKSDLR